MSGKPYPEGVTEIVKALARCDGQKGAAVKPADEYRKAYVFGRCDKHGLNKELNMVGPSISCGSCLTEMFEQCQREAIEAAAHEADIIAAEEGAKFTVGDTEVEIGRDVATAIRALLPPATATDDGQGGG